MSKQTLFSTAPALLAAFSLVVTSCGSSPAPTTPTTPPPPPAPAPSEPYEMSYTDKVLTAGLLAAFAGTVGGLIGDNTQQTSEEQERNWLNDDAGAVEEERARQREKEIRDALPDFT